MVFNSGFFSQEMCFFFQFLHSLWCKFGTPSCSNVVFTKKSTQSRPCSQKSIAWIVVCVVLSLFERSGCYSCEAYAVQGQNHETRKQNAHEQWRTSYLRLFYIYFSFSWEDHCAIYHTNTLFHWSCFSNTIIVEHIYRIIYIYTYIYIYIYIYICVPYFVSQHIYHQPPANPAGLSWAWDCKQQGQKHHQKQQQQQQHHSIALSGRNSIASSMARSTTKSNSNSSNNQQQQRQPQQQQHQEVHSQQLTANGQQEQQHGRGHRGNRARDLLDMGWFWWSWCLYLCLWLALGGGVFYCFKAK